jgi:hypothetical protein
MKAFLLLAVAASLFFVPASHAAFGDAWMIGTDNNSQADFETESGAGDNYYLENGDYTSVGGIVWTQGREPLIVTTNVGDYDGFERALVPGDPTENIFFQLNAAQVTPSAQLRFTVDFFSLGATSSHDLEIRLNGTLLRTLPAVTAPRTEVITGSPSALGAQLGPNKLTVTRTGGSATNPFIQFDYLRLETDPPRVISSFTSNVSSVRAGGTVTLSWTALPTATLSLAPGVGSLASYTVSGVGTITLTPTQTTTYTLTAVDGATTESASLNVDFNPYAITWLAGTDNGITDEFSHEAAADDDYYFAGNYTSVGGANLAVSESLRDDSTAAVIDGNPAIGFERALTAGDPSSNIWFVLPPAKATVSSVYRLSFDLLAVSGGNTTHDIVFTMNGLGAQTVSNITTPRLITIEWSGATVNPVAGPNKITYNRTGGTAGAYLTIDYVMLEDRTTFPVNVDSVTSDSILGTRTLFWTGIVGKTYLIQKSADNTLWTTLANSFPTGGAAVTGQFYEDRVTPSTDPQPFYRIFQE